MKKFISGFSFVLVGLLFLFFYFKFSYENNLKSFLKENYKEDISFKNINCVNFINDSCIIEELTYTINNNTIKAKETKINYISDLNNILNKNIHENEIKTFKISFDEITLNELSIKNSNKHLNATIEFLLIKENNSFISQIKTDIKYDEDLYLTNKSNLIEENNDIFLNNNKLELKFSKKDFFSFLYNIYKKEWQSSLDKLTFNKSFNYNQEYLLSEKEFEIKIYELKESFLNNFPSNNLISFFNKNDQLKNKISNLFNSNQDLVSISINIYNVNQETNQNLFNGFSYFLRKQIIPEELKYLTIEII